MRNIFKKKITKGFLLFLFTFFSVGIQAQSEWSDYGGTVIEYTDIYAYLADNPCVKIAYDFKPFCNNHPLANGYSELENYLDNLTDYEKTLVSNAYEGEHGCEFRNAPVPASLNFDDCGFSSGSNPPPPIANSGLFDIFTWNPYNDGSGAYDPISTGSGGSGTIGGYSMGTHGSKPLTETQFGSWKGQHVWSRSDYFYSKTTKANQKITTADGKTHVGTLYKFKKDLVTNPHIFYYFKPSSSQTLSTDLYYFFPDKIGDKATTNLNSTTTIDNLGINYTYDKTGFPRGQGYYINAAGVATRATFSENVSLANLESYTLPNTNIYNNKYYITGYSFGGNVFHKIENNIPIFAPIHEQFMYNSFGNLHLHHILQYYKTKINTNSSITSDSNIINAELKSYLAKNGPLPAVSEEFIDWFESVTAIQVGAVNNDFVFLEAPEFSRAFAEDDDILKLNSTDPFFTDNPDDPFRFKKLLQAEHPYIAGLLAGLGDGIIETADLAYTLSKFAVKNHPKVLFLRLVVDTENTIKEKIEEIKFVKDLVSVIFDKPKQDQIFASIKTAMGTWFEETTFQKTDVQAGYQQGKILFEIIGAFLGVAEVKALLKTGQFAASALNAINKIDGIIKKGFKFVKRDGVTSLVDDKGEVLATGINATKELAEKIAKWTNADGSVKWPPNSGFDGVVNRTNIPVGSKIDRYGEPDGRFTSPAGTNRGKRALYPGTTTQLRSYQVIQPVPAKTGKALPWFDEVGGGIQYEFDENIQWLLDNDYIIEI